MKTFTHFYNEALAWDSADTSGIPVDLLTCLKTAQNTLIKDLYAKTQSDENIAGSQAIIDIVGECIKKRQLTTAFIDVLETYPWLLLDITELQEKTGKEAATVQFTIKSIPIGSPIDVVFSLDDLSGDMSDGGGPEADNEEGWEPQSSDLDFDDLCCKYSDPDFIADLKRRMSNEVKALRRNKHIITIELTQLKSRIPSLELSDYGKNLLTQAVKSCIKQNDISKQMIDAIDSIGGEFIPDFNKYYPAVAIVFTLNGKKLKHGYLEF